MKAIFKKRFSTMVTIVCVGMALLSSCKKDEPEVVYGDAKIRVVNTVQGSNAQDFYQNDMKVSTSAVAYGSYSAYLTLKAGPSNITFKDAASTTLSASSKIGLVTDVSYTAFYYRNEFGVGDITGFEDDNTSISGKARVRFVNLGRGFNNTVNVTLPVGTSLATGLAYGYVSGYSTIDAGAALNVSILGSAPITIDGSNFASGKAYTVWLDVATATSANYHIIQQN